MALVAPSASEDRLLGWVLITVNPSIQTLKLFKTNVTVAASVVGDFAEADYSVKALTRCSWSISQARSKTSAACAENPLG